MKLISKNDWIPNGNVVLEKNAEYSVKYDSNILVVAGPGAGKTEMLAQKAAYLFQTNTCKYPQRILAISFKTDAAANLKERVCERCGDEIKNRFSSMTYDAFAKRTLDRFRLSLPLELQPEKEYEINNINTIKEALFKVGCISRTNISKNQLNELLSHFLIKSNFPPKKNSIEEKLWTLLIKGFDGKRATLTFKMISQLVTYIFKVNPKLRKFLQLTYTYVFLDEFQDTTDLQYELIKICFKNSYVKITAVGDNKQRIMKWAGARETVFIDFINDFCACKKQLIMNHRSAPKLVMLQKQMYNALNEFNLTVEPSSKWNDNDGQIKLLETASEESEAEEIIKDINEKISMGILPNEICILCKQKVKEYSQTLIGKLHEKGIRARIEENYQSLLKEPIVELLIKFITVSLDRRRPKEWEVIRESSKNILGIGDFTNDINYYKFQDELIGTLNLVKEKINDNEILMRNIVKVIIDFLGESNICACYPEYKQIEYLRDILEKFEYYFTKELEQCAYDWEYALDSFCGKYSIPIMTIHKSKGLEYNAIYFIGLEDAAFWNFLKQSDEDRCTFFVALSRAKEYLMFTYCSNRKSFEYNSRQSRKNINEFFELLKNSNVVEIINKE